MLSSKIEKFIKYLSENSGNPLYLCEPASFNIISLTDSAKNLFEPVYLDKGCSLAPVLPGHIKQKIKTHCFSEKKQLHDLKLNIGSFRNNLYGSLDVVRPANIATEGPWLFNFKLKHKPPAKKSCIELFHWVYWWAQGAVFEKLTTTVHDHLGPEITLTQIGLTLLKNEIQEKAHNTYCDFQDIEIRIAELSAQVALLAQKARNLQQELSPITSEVRVIEAIKNLVKKFSAIYPNKIDFSYQPQFNELPNHHSVHIYGAVTEMLNNCAKHSFANHVMIKLELVADTGLVQVWDDGVGLGVGSSLNSTKKFKALKLRANSLRGQLTVKNRATGQGTVAQIAFKFPILH